MYITTAGHISAKPQETRERVGNFVAQKLLKSQVREMLKKSCGGQGRREPASPSKKERKKARSGGYCNILKLKRGPVKNVLWDWKTPTRRESQCSSDSLFGSGRVEWYVGLTSTNWYAPGSTWAYEHGRALNRSEKAEERTTISGRLATICKWVGSRTPKNTGRSIFDRTSWRS